MYGCDYGQNQRNFQNFQPMNNNIPFQNNNIPRLNTSTDGRIWVQNETSAEAYLLAPNEFVRLWDSSRPVFYEKRADATGRPLPMDVYEYNKILLKNDGVNDTPNNLPLEDINARFDEITSRIEALEKVKKVTKNVKQSNDDDTSI